MVALWSRCGREMIAIVSAKAHSIQRQHPAAFGVFIGQQ
jgi:hypothetical protein